ncbi:hypothetical protein UFOVP620_9 [uncultured Caudovirales phage]|uniref:Uncharacterized protein n=1 Tax=uncultured Caudovirales phage TaxID=2100421 RepID=A0A6J5MZJ2_9CAUD|nr:hypothetical protein UFOVP620_9 [uncultured Caudovirales phage]
MTDEISSLILGTPQPKSTKSNIRYAADLNNPSGYGYDGKTWKSYETPEEGVNETMNAIQQKITTKGFNTPEKLAGNWVTGDATQNPQNGKYAENIRKELFSVGLKLNPDGSIPNSPDAIQAVTRAIIKNETAKQHQDKFLNVLDAPKDEVSALIMGTPLPKKPTVDVTQQVNQPTVQPTTQAATQPTTDQTGAFVGYPTLTRQAQNAAPSQARPALEQTGKDLTNPAFVAKDLAALFDNTVGSVLPFFTKKITQAGTRFLGAEQAAEISDRLTGYVDKPLGKAFGITEDPVYQNQALGKIMAFIGENKEKGDEWIAKNLDMNKNDVQFFTDMALIKAGQEPTKIIKKPLEAVENVATSLQEAIGEMKKPKDKTATVTLEGVNYQPDMVGVGAAKTEINPYRGFTGEDIQSKGEFPQVKLSRIAKDVPITEQTKIAQIVNEIGGGQLGLREGVKTRNENTLRNEFAEAKNPNPTLKGQLLKDQIANEQNALYNYAENRIQNTGANKNLISDYERGQVIYDAMASEEGLLGYFKKQKQETFQEAKNMVGDKPITTTHVNDLLSDPQFKAGLGLKKNEGVAASAEELIRLAKEVGFKDEFGVTHPAGSISAYDAVKKSLNSGWSPENASIIGRINRAIDQDIASAGGQELYKKGDRLHEAEKTLFESKGMKELFGQLDPNGIQTGVPFEKMITKLNQMPIDQWKHVFDTLSLLENGLVKTKKFEVQVPKEIQDYARVAKAEILGGLAREIYQSGAKNAGEWNKNAVHTILNARIDKIKHGFSPEEQKAFHTLNYGGHFLQPKHEYEGAGLQGRRVGAIASRLPASLEALGALSGNPLVSMGGRKAGEFGERKLTTRAEEKEAAKLQEQLKKNIKLSDIGK